MFAFLVIFMYLMGALNLAIMVWRWEVETLVITTETWAICIGAMVVKWREIQRDKRTRI